MTEAEEFEFRRRLERESAGGSKALAANAGLANLLASTVGAPMDIVQGVVNAPAMVYGGLKAALTGKAGPDVPVENIHGGSENVRNMMRRASDATGIKGLSPDNPNPDSKLGTAAYDFVSRGGVVPGAVLPAAASIVAEKIGGPEWAGVGALAPSGVTAGFNAARAPGLRREQAQNQVRDATLRQAQDAGYVVPPSTVKPTLVGNAVESFAGKAAIRQEAEIKNQQVTNRLVREELGLPENTPLTERVLETHRAQAAQPYRDVAALSPMAANALQRLRDARAEANVQHRHYDMTGTPDALRQARALDAQAAQLERVLEHQATARGRPDLLPALRQARTEIAKTWDVERALNIGNGNVDAKIIGRALDRGRPLSGNLETIGRFAEGPGRLFTREESRVPAAGVSALNWPAAAVLGVEGSHYMGPAGAALAAVPFVRGGVRGGVLSDAYQQRFNRPDYTPNMQPQSPLQAAIQQAIMANEK